MQLKDYQFESRDFLAARRAALLADEPRVGKTAPSIKAADLLEDIAVVGVVCPAHVRENWVREIEAWRQNQWIAVVFSYEKAPEVLRKVAFNKLHFDVLIVDESHYAKTRTSKRTKAVYGKDCDGTDGLVAHADRVWCLTGTPQPNAPSELWTMLRAIAPEIIMRSSGRPMPFSIFEAKYCSKISTPFGMKVVGSKNAKELKEKLKGFVLRRTRLEALGSDLQPWSQFIVAAPAANARELRRLTDSPEGRAMLRALERGGIRELKREGGAAELRRMLGIAKVPGLVDFVTDELNTDVEKVVIGAYHTDVINKLRDGFSKFHPLVIDGHTPDKMRQRDLFQNAKKHRVMIGQIKAAGTGLDLSAADNYIGAEVDWVGDNNEQISARIYNTEKKRPCFRRFAVLAGGIDEKIIRASTGKTKDSRKVFS